MRRLILVAAFLAVGCDAGETPADEPVADAQAGVVQVAGPVGLERAVADTTPSNDAPAVLFEHEVRPAQDGSRRAHDALILACRGSRAACRVAASDVSMLGAGHAFGDVTLEIGRSEAEQFNRKAVRALLAARAEIVQSRTHDVPPPVAAAGAPAAPDKVRLLFHYPDPRSGLDRRFERIARNVGATAGLLFVILGSVAPWLLIAWLLARLNNWRQRRKDSRKEAERAAG